MNLQLGNLKYPPNLCRICIQLYCCEACRIDHEATFHKIFPTCKICIFGFVAVDDLWKSTIELLEHTKVHLPSYCFKCSRRFLTIKDIFDKSTCTFCCKNRNKLILSPDPSLFLNFNSPNSDTMRLRSSSGLTAATSTPMNRNEDLVAVDPNATTPANNNNNVGEKGAVNEKTKDDSKKRKVTFVDTPESESSINCAQVDPSEVTLDFMSTNPPVYADNLDTSIELSFHSVHDNSFKDSDQESKEDPLQIHETPAKEQNVKTVFAEIHSPPTPKKKLQSILKTPPTNKKMKQSFKTPSNDQIEVSQFKTPANKPSYAVFKTPAPVQKKSVLDEIINVNPGPSSTVWETASNITAQDTPEEKQAVKEDRAKIFLETPQHSVPSRKINAAVKLVKMKMPTSTPNQIEGSTFDESDCLSRISMLGRSAEKSFLKFKKDDEVKPAEQETDNAAGNANSPLIIKDLIRDFNEDKKDDVQNIKIKVEPEDPEEAGGNLLNRDIKQEVVGEVEENENQTLSSSSIKEEDVKPGPSKTPTIWKRVSGFFNLFLEPSTSRENKPLKRSISDTTDFSTVEPTQKRFKYVDIKCRPSIREMPSLTWYRDLSDNTPPKKTFADKATQTDE